MLQEGSPFYKTISPVRDWLLGFLPAKRVVERGIPNFKHPGQPLRSVSLYKAFHKAYRRSLSPDWSKLLHKALYGVLCSRVTPMHKIHDTPEEKQTLAIQRVHIEHDAPRTTSHARRARPKHVVRW